MSTKQEQKCPDCAGDLHQIKLLLPAGRGHHVKGIEYAHPDIKKRGFWSERFPSHGKVEAFVCDQCGRIFWYAVPHE